MSALLQVRTVASQGATIREANEFLRRGDFSRATGAFARVLHHWPAMTRTLGGSLGMARDAYLRSRQPEAPLRVGVAGWDLAHNAAGRAHTLAAIYRRFAEPEIIGPLFATNGREVWEPVRHTGFAFHHFVVEDEGAFLDQAVDLVAAHPYDLVHLSKPRFPNIVLGLLYKLIWRSRVLVDIDDEELSFVGATESLPLENYLRQHGELPPVQNLAGPLWTRLAVGLADAFDGVTVSNHVLQARYGGTIIPHARDERVFQPSPALRSQGRAKLGIPPDRKVVLFLGTPADYKGLPLVARAVGQLGRDDVTFLLAGGLFDETLQAELQKLSGDRCRFTGYEPFDQIPATIAAADCCCFLQDPTHPVSRFQMPAKLSDALALGVPCLVSPSLVLQEACDHQACLPVDEAALVPQLRRLLDDRNHAAAQSQSARAFFRLRLAADQASQTLQSLAQPPPSDPQAFAPHSRLGPCLAHLDLAAFLPSLNAFPPSVNGQEAAREINGHTSPAVVETTTTEVDVIVPVHDALPDVKECLRSLGAHTDGFNVRIIVVDDASSPATRDWLHEFCAADSRFHLVTHPHNRGYTCSVNTGLKLSEAAYVVIQNSDTIVTPGWLSSLVRCIESDPAIGLAGPLSNAASWQNVPELRDKDGNFAINALPDGLGPADMAALVAHCSARSYPRVPFLNGFSYIIKKEVIGKIGLMDEASFPQGYGEENDFCLRAADAGYQLAVADDAFVFHAKSKSFGHDKRQQLSQEASEAIRRKHGKEKFEQFLEKAKQTAPLDEVRSRIAPLLGKHKELENAKILFLLPVTGGGGGAHSVVQEASEMMRMGIAVKVAVRPEQIDGFRASYARLPEVNDLFITFTDELLLEIAGDYDIVVATVFHTVKLLDRICAAHPHILPAYYIQDYEVAFFEKQSKQWQEATASYTLIPHAVLFAKTQWLVETISRGHNVRVSKVLPSLDRSVYHGDQRPDSETVRLCAMIRPHTPYRGAKRTMQILKRLKQDPRGKVEVVIFGADPSSAEFADLETDFPHTNLGRLRREEVAEALSSADLFLDLSDYQAFGRTALEAMACGCAVVVPKAGGTGEFAVNGTNALVVDTANTEDCYRQIRGLTLDRQSLRRLQSSGRSTAARFGSRTAALSECALLGAALASHRARFPKARKNTLLLVPSLRDDGVPTGSGYVRVVLPYGSQGVQSRWKVHSVSSALPSPDAAEVAVLQRDASSFDFPELVAWTAMWKRHGGRLIYEIDDDLLDEEGLRLRHFGGDPEELRRRVVHLLTAADIVTVSTEHLGARLAPFTRSVQVIPNRLDARLWRLQEPRNRPPRLAGQPIRIGYVGTHTHDREMDFLAPAMQALQAKHGNLIEIEVIGAFQRRPASFGQRVGLPKRTEYPQFVTWLLQRAQWDIGLVPLVDDSFNRSKSNLKFLETAALETAMVCSAAPSYRDVAVHGDNCLIAEENPDAWVRAIDELIADQSLRERLARKARADVAAHHTLSVTEHQLVGLLESLTGMPTTPGRRRSGALT